MGQLWFARGGRRHAGPPPSTALRSVDDRRLRSVTGDKCRDTIVVFWRSGCLPCYAMAPEFERLEREFAGLTVVQADVDAAPRAVQRYDVAFVPTAIRFHHRLPAVASVGVTSYETLLRRLVLAPPSL